MEDTKQAEEVQLPRLFKSDAPYRLADEGETQDEYRYRRKVMIDLIKQRQRGVLTFVAKTKGIDRKEDKKIKGKIFRKNDYTEDELKQSELNAELKLRGLTVEAVVATEEIKAEMRRKNKSVITEEIREEKSKEEENKIIDNATDNKHTNEQGEVLPAVSDNIEADTQTQG